MGYNQPSWYETNHLELWDTLVIPNPIDSSWNERTIMMVALNFDVWSPRRGSSLSWLIQRQNKNTRTILVLSWQIHYVCIYGLLILYIYIYMYIYIMYQCIYVYRFNLTASYQCHDTCCILKSLRVPTPCCSAKACANCGHMLQADSVYCRKCGHKREQARLKHLWWW